MQIGNFSIFYRCFQCFIFIYLFFFRNATVDAKEEMNGKEEIYHLLLN